MKKRDAIGLAMLGLMFASNGMMAMSEHRQAFDEKPKKKSIPKGCSEYVFWHGGEQFTCIASNSKQAEKKFEKWRTNQPQG